MKTVIFSFLRLSTIFPVVTATVVGFSSPALAVTGFTGVFDPNKFTLNNDNADGFICYDNISEECVKTDADAANGTVVLTGGNNDSLASGITTWITTSPITPGQTISFAWSFQGELTPQQDSGGYIIGYVINKPDNYIPLGTGGGETGLNEGNIPSLTLEAGQFFGFFVETANNTGNPGVLTINQFDFEPAPVPLETDALPVVVSLLFFGVGVWFKQRNGKK